MQEFCNFQYNYWLHRCECTQCGFIDIASSDCNITRRCKYANSEHSSKSLDDRCVWISIATLDDNILLFKCGVCAKRISITIDDLNKKFSGDIDNFFDIYAPCMGQSYRLENQQKYNSITDINNISKIDTQYHTHNRLALQNYNTVKQPLSAEVKDAGEKLGWTLEHIRRWRKALANWIKNGRPLRTDEEVKKIIEICEQCEEYKHNEKRCGLCGCKVNTGGMAVFNKARMGTEYCEKHKWDDI